MIYLTGASGGVTREMAYRINLGLMLQPGNGYLTLAEDFPHWAADNGCFAQGDRFKIETWLEWLARVPLVRCLFAVAPDVFPDALATLERSRLLLPRVRSMGFRVAFVAQNDAERYEMPWDAFDCLFLGGEDRWKLGAGARHLTREAKSRGKWVHMGRVNSERRLRYATLIGCDSSDGTFLKYGPNVNRPRLEGWFRQHLLAFR